MKISDVTHIALTKVLDDKLKKNQGLQFINVSTTDGFPIFTVTKINSELEEDKLAATSSTLCSVSRAVATQILKTSFQMSLIETNKGNIVFVATRYKNGDVILSMSAGSELNLATLRHTIKGLAQKISAL